MESITTSRISQDFLFKNKWSWNTLFNIERKENKGNSKPDLKRNHTPAYVNIREVKQERINFKWTGNYFSKMSEYKGKVQSG